jgi:hypothetical protein
MTADRQMLGMVVSHNICELQEKEELRVTKLQTSALCEASKRYPFAI